MISRGFLIVTRLPSRLAVSSESFFYGCPPAHRPYNTIQTNEAIETVDRERNRLNYLAHLYLADQTDDSLIGNLLGDFVKGRPGERYSDEIVAGILFHRKIDAFADAHPIMRASRGRIAPRMSRFSGIIVDVCYDHFLARHWRRFSSHDLTAFVQHAYDVLQKNRPILPERLQRILPYMISEDWLGHYIEIKRVGETLDRITRRLTHGERFKGAIVEVEKNYADLESDFLNFFPDLVDYAHCTKLEYNHN
jgi:acyl carrier protein phosphodiesterase